LPDSLMRFIATEKKMTNITFDPSSFIAQTKRELKSDTDVTDNFGRGRTQW